MGVRHSTRVGLLLLGILAITLPLVVIFSRQQQQTQQKAAGNILTVGMYEKFELTYPYSGSYSNPYDPAIVDVEAVFTSPTGKTQTVPGFYFQDYTRSGNAGGETLTVNGSPVWKVRFAPSETGKYLYVITLKDASGTKSLDSGSFTVTSSSNPGYVRISGYHFQFDNGQFFIPRGHNLYAFDPRNSTNSAWGAGSYGADALVSAFSANHANFVHVFMCEWLKTQNAPSGPFNIACGDPKTQPRTLMQMNQQDSWDMDYFLNAAEQHNIYIMPILKLRDMPNFDPGDKIMDRYAVARWGYSTRIMGWDTFKEGGTSPTDVANDISYLRSVDPYNHPITVSQFDHYGTDGSRPNYITIYKQIFSQTGTGASDIVQDHDYSSECNDQLDNDTSLYIANLITNPNAPVDIRNFFKKPFWFGETGVQTCNTIGHQHVSPFYTSDPQALIYHGELWGQLMTTSIAGSPWWWDIDTNNNKILTPFIGINGFINQLPQGAIPDSAVPFALLNNPTQVSASDQRIQVIGRKNQTFAMIHVQNETGNWASIVRDHQTPIPLSPTVTLHAMYPTTQFTINWIDTNSGNSLSLTHSISSANGDLTLTAPQITTDLAAIIVSQSAITPTVTPTPTFSVTPTPFPTVTPTPSSRNTQFSVTICPHGLGNCGDNANPSSGGNTNPLHITRNISLNISDTNNNPVVGSPFSGQVTYVSSSQNFQGTISIPNLGNGQYLVSIKMDGFLGKKIPGVITVSQGKTITVSEVSLTAGDINNDNQLDIQDYNILISCFDMKYNTVSCLAQNASLSPGADIDDDGVVDGADYNLFLRELSVQNGE